MNIENPPELIEYLISRNIISDTDEISVVKLEGGVSNRTVKVEFLDKAWVIKQALKKLRVSGNWFSPPERIYHEAEGMRWLNQHVPGITPVLIFEDQPQYLLVMEAIPTPFENLKEQLLLGIPDLDLIESAGRMLGRIHRLGEDLDKVPEILLDTGFFKSLRVDPYYQHLMLNIPLNGLSN